MAHLAGYKQSNAAALKIWKVERIAQRADEEFKKYNSYYDISTYPDGTIKVEVEWGDWKHDHLFVDMVMKELGAKHYSTDVTEEDGSDCYSAIHTFTL